MHLGVGDPQALDQVFQALMIPDIYPDIPLFKALWQKIIQGEINRQWGNPGVLLKKCCHNIYPACQFAVVKWPGRLLFAKVGDEKLALPACSAIKEIFPCE